MKLAGPALTTLLALGGCNADRTTASATSDAARPASTATLGMAQTASIAKAAALANDANDTVPVPFQGRWATDSVACRKPADESQLELQAHRAAFYEGSGPIKSVVVDEDVITLVAELSAEGETNETTYAFRLSDNGTTLTDISTGPGMVRHRC
jgi:Cu/Ag efflux protein CusF